MALNTINKIFRQSWDLIPMSDMVISCVNTLSDDQPKQLTFIDRHGHLIVDLEIPGLGAESEEEDFELP